MLGIKSIESNCGVVGYHIRLTRERSPVRTRAVAFLSEIDYISLIIVAIVIIFVILILLLLSLMIRSKNDSKNFIDVVILRINNL